MQVVLNPSPVMHAAPLQLCTVSADGAPLLGSHPGFEAQQVVVCVPGRQCMRIEHCSMYFQLDVFNVNKIPTACGGEAGTVCGAAAVPLLSACAAALVTGRAPPADVDMGRLDPTRGAIGMGSAALTVDSWEAWHAQQLQAAIQAEAEAALARERAMDERSSFQERWLPRGGKTSLF